MTAPLGQTRAVSTCVRPCTMAGPSFPIASRFTLVARSGATRGLVYLNENIGSRHACPSSRPHVMAERCSAQPVLNFRHRWVDFQSVRRSAFPKRGRRPAWSSRAVGRYLRSSLGYGGSAYPAQLDAKRSQQARHWKSEPSGKKRGEPPPDDLMVTFPDPQQRRAPTYVGYKFVGQKDII